MTANKQDFFTAQEVSAKSLEYFNGDELATSTFVNKYALKQATDDEVLFCEATPEDMHNRLATAFSRIENKYPNPRSLNDFKEGLDHFKYIVPGGSVMYGVGNPYVNVSLSNCIALAGPHDSMSGIIDKSKDMANLFKARAGVGIPLDTLRPDGSLVNNSAGSSTGAWSFANYYSEVCRMVGQAGRRGALILTMSVRHPDIEKFITMKNDLTKVTGANISVMVTDDFMNAVKDDADWTLQWPIDVPLEEARYTQVIKAKDLWFKINESATKVAEPGLIFIDNYKKNLPADKYPDFKSVCVNPCSEILLSEFDSCRLTSINLKGFVINPFKENSSFDFNNFEKMTRLAMRILDNIIDLEIECLNNMIEKLDDESEITLWKKLKKAAEDGRRTGLGTHGLADALACLGIKYDTKEARIMANTIYSEFRNNAYDESVNLAIERGSFSCFDWDIEKDCDFIQRLPQDLQNRIQKYGRRNISLLTNAPTGSISIISQTSSGIEPVFMNFYTRRKKISNETDRVDFIDDSGDRWGEYPVFHHNIMEYLKTNNLLEEWQSIQENTKSSEWANEITKIIPDYFITAMEIDPYERVKIQGDIQLNLDHGISSTINLPKGTTVEQVQNIYESAWQHKLKGVTVYVDGSRSGVLVSSEDSKKDMNLIKRPKELPCEIHHSTIDGQKWTIFVGLSNDKPYEIFGGLAEYVTIPKKYKFGKITKTKNGHKNVNGRYAFYNLVIDDEDGDPLEVQNIAVTFNNGNYAAQTRMISLALRNGVPVQHVAEQLSRDENSDFFSFSKVMSRVLKKYIEDGSESSDNCEICNEKLRFEGGCQYCPGCGNSSKCG